MVLVDKYLPGETDLDKEFKTHIVFVLNRVLVNYNSIRDPDRIKKIGRLLMRFGRVAQLYGKKKKGYSRLRDIASQLDDILDAFGG